MKKKVAILGASGMLGSMLLDYFSKSKEFKIIATVRSQKELLALSKYKKVEFKVLDVEFADQQVLRKALKGAAWVINAIGIIKPYIHDDNAVEIERALRINALFPHNLARALEKTKIIQIATDCVYSGAKGAYKENDPHDALDVYGKTKSIGEAHFGNFYNLRCSIIGPELSSHLSLMDWFLTRPEGSKVNGYTNHFWNGVTTLHFAKLCEGIIAREIKIAHLQHLIPTGKISKYEMLKIFANEFNRPDTTITKTNAPEIIDRTLSTEKPKINKKIWQAAGYSKIPSVPEMIRELGDYLSKNE